MNNRLVKLEARKARLLQNEDVNRNLIRKVNRLIKKYQVKDR